MKRITVLLLVCLAVVLIFHVVDGMAGKSKTPSATVTFWNGPDDNIKSDGNLYQDGVRGILCAVRTDSNQELILNIVGTARRLWYNFPDYARLDTACADPTGPTSAAGGLAVDGYVNIHGIGAIQIGEIRAVRANFNAQSAGQFNFLDNFGVPPNNPYACSTNVAVYRKDQWTWHISTSVARLIGSDQPVYDATGTLVTPGSTAQLNSLPSHLLNGNYTMPFALTVSCPTCPAPQPCAIWPCPIPQ